MQRKKLYLFPGRQKDCQGDNTILVRGFPVLYRCKQCRNTRKFLASNHLPVTILTAAVEPFQYAVLQYTIGENELLQKIHACAECGSSDVGVYPVRLVADIPGGAGLLSELSHMLNDGIVHKLSCKTSDPLPPQTRDVVLVGNDSFVAADQRTASFLTTLHLRAE